MPTDLPKNFSGTDPLGDVKAKMKAQNKLARKAAYQSLWGIAKALMLHYGLTLAGVAVIALSGFSDVPRAALSATAIGLLARWYLPNQARARADQLRQPGPFQGAEVVELTPDQLKDFFSKLGQDGAADAAPEPSPYM